MLGVIRLACDDVFTFDLSDGLPSRKAMHLTRRAKESGESRTRVWFGLEIPSIR